jgi:hypothetical protein
MPDILIKAIDANTYEIKVNANYPSTHIVTIRPDYASTLTGGHASTEKLLEQSFNFLLARESNTSILRSFDLSVIARYFPEYEREIARLLSSN